MLEQHSDRIHAGLLGAMLVAAFWVLAVTPPDARVAIHFDAQGTPNGWATPAGAVFLMPGLAALMWGLFKLLPKIDPRADNLARSAAAVAAIGIAVNVLLAVLQGVILGGALGRPAPAAHLGLVLVGGLFAVIGNVMGKLRPNYTVGIRTPWTLANERVWDQTHRFGGKVFVGGGLLLCALAATPIEMDWMGPAIVGVSLVCAAVPALKSYLLWRNMQRKDQTAD
jgi:uncharacterized membrane protein